MKSDNWHKRLDEFHTHISSLNRTFIGYPTNSKFDWPEINNFLHFTLNNAGDPFGNSHYLMNSHQFEKEVVTEMGTIMGLGPSEVWGYVNNGGTEGNLEGLWLARERLPESVVLYSADTHYSVSKIIKMLKMDSLEIPSLANGEIDYTLLESALDANYKKQIVIVANFGTTMKGAIDNLQTIESILSSKKINQFYVHVDAALFGMVSQLIPCDHHLNFKKYHIDSVSISGHKFIGSPMPSGLFITKKSNIDTVKRNIEYVGISDTTITGSRNALSPIIWWLALNKFGIEHYAKLAKSCVDLAIQFRDKLILLGFEAYTNPDSNIVWFNKPSDHICHKWQLATYGQVAHVVVMPHVTSSKLEEFLKDLKNKAVLNKTHHKQRKNTKQWSNAN